MRKRVSSCKHRVVFFSRSHRRKWKCVYENCKEIKLCGKIFVYIRWKWYARQGTRLSIETYSMARIMCMSVSVFVFVYIIFRYDYL